MSTSEGSCEKYSRASSSIYKQHTITVIVTGIIKPPQQHQILVT